MPPDDRRGLHVAAIFRAVLAFSIRPFQSSSLSRNGLAHWALATSLAGNLPTAPRVGCHHRASRSAHWPARSAWKAHRERDGSRVPTNCDGALVILSSQLQTPGALHLQSRYRAQGGGLLNLGCASVGKHNARKWTAQSTPTKRINVEIMLLCIRRILILIAFFFPQGS